MIPQQTVKLQTLSEVAQDDGSQTSTWVTRCHLMAYIHGKGIGRENSYDRDSIRREVVLIIADNLPKRVDGYTSLSKFLNGVTTETVRFLETNRTLSFEKMESDGTPPPGCWDVLRITCIETPQPVGFMDK